MSRPNLAYITEFYSLDDSHYEIEITVEGHQGDPTPIRLEGDEPCVIEWQETSKTDVVQASTCTLRVSNEHDRQMLALMVQRNAALFVIRDGEEYWRGTLDDSVYEEPYSFKDGYVTELTFSDFGILNRMPFTLTGRQSVQRIVYHCLEGSGLDYLYEELLTTLCHKKGPTPIKLTDLYINADRFRADGDGWGEYTSKREVLEEVLRPLGLRIVQRNGQLYIYDIEYLRDNDLSDHVVWKGTDAFLRGEPTFGWYEVGFEPDAEETLIEMADPYADMDVDTKYRARYRDEDTGDEDDGFYIRIDRTTWPEGTMNQSGARPFKTRSHLTSGSYFGHAWIIHCQFRSDQNVITPPRVLNNVWARWPVNNPPGFAYLPVASPIAQPLLSAYIPLIENGSDRYQLRVNLDLLFSLKQNPFEETSQWNLFTEASGITPARYKDVWTKKMLRVFVPVKLELVDEQGNVMMHYENTAARFDNNFQYLPLKLGEGHWVTGAAGFGNMMLAYYKDGYEESPLEGWATNRQSMHHQQLYLPSLYKKREQGEYVPMPPLAGRLRFTLSNCVYLPFYALPDAYAKYICWHLLAKPRVTLVKAAEIDDGIKTDTVYNRHRTDNPQPDHFNETLMADSWSKGVPPSARGLFFNADGVAYELFYKNGMLRTLGGHRLSCVEDQTAEPQPSISGTAELDPAFYAKREDATPGIFLVTSLRQDLHQGTEHLAMARIGGAGVGWQHSNVYSFAWSGPVCAEEEEPYSFEWSGPVCAEDPGPYQFSWGGPVCAEYYHYALEWEGM